MAVYYAQNSDIGRWQVAYEDDPESWTDLEASTDLEDVFTDLRQAGVFDATERGPLPISDYVEQLACEFEPNQSSLTNPEDASFWTQVIIILSP